MGEGRGLACGRRGDATTVEPEIFKGVETVFCWRHMDEKLEILVPAMFCLELEFVYSWALFSSPQKPKIFKDFSSRRILQHMHEVLNMVKNKN